MLLMPQNTSTASTKIENIVIRVWNAIEQAWIEQESIVVGAPAHTKNVDLAFCQEISHKSLTITLTNAAGLDVNLESEWLPSGDSW